MRFFRFTLIIGLAAVTAFGSLACTPHSAQLDTATPGGIEGYELPSASAGGECETSFAAVVSAIRSARAVVVGEAHDRLDHHLNQLALIRKLHRANANLAIGMEQFQQPFQSHLDDYIDGSIDTEQMLIETAYFDRWKFDYRLYDPILSYARKHGIRVIALNVPTELTRKVAAGGLEALSESEAARIPRLDRSDTDYRRRLREVFDRHPEGFHGGSFENFYTAQLLWDEGMAARAAEYLDSHPDQMMVILAGEGHVEFGSGIPERVRRRIQGDVVTVVHRRGDTAESQRADYILCSERVELPEGGILGVMIESDADNARVSALADESAAGAAGVQVGDVITAVDGRPVSDLAELKARLWDKRPGDRVEITIHRAQDTTLRREVILTGSGVGPS